MKHTYAGELQFKRYSDTSTQGQSVTFLVPSRKELEPFIGLEGKRFQAVFVMIGDDEMPAEPEKKPESEREYLGPLCWRAVSWCGDPMFQKWLGTQALLANMTEIDAKAIICRECEIESRKELDSNGKAATIFHKKFRLPYMNWLKKHGVAA